MKKVKIGIVGLGNMGSAHLEKIKNLDNAEVGAVCDLKTELADKKASEFNVKAYYDAENLYKSGDIDAVLIATPHYDHTPLTIKAFKAGLHVLTEKPIAVHKADAEKMVEAHKAYPELKFAAMFQMRTMGINQKVKKLIDTGELGEIKRVNWIITNWFRTQAYYNSGGWRATWKGEGGGVLLNQCPHQLDLFQWFFGMPIKMRAFCALGKYHDIEVEDDVTAYCEFANKATGAFITSTGEAPGTNRLEITGDKGRLLVEDDSIKFKRNEENVSEFLNNAKGGFDKPELWEIEIPYNNSDDDQHQKVIANFADSILNDTKLIAEAEDGINSVELANSMLLSSMDDKTVELPVDGDYFEKKLLNLIENSTFVKKNVKEDGPADLSSSYNK